MYCITPPYYAVVAGRLEAVMVPKITQIDTEQATWQTASELRSAVERYLKQVTSAPPSPDSDSRSAIRSAFLKAFKDGWERNKEAYRYLGR